MPKRKTKELGSVSKSEIASLKRLFSGGRAANGSVRNLTKARGPKKEKRTFFFLQNKRYRIQKFGPPIRRFRRLPVCSKNIVENVV